MLRSPGLVTRVRHEWHRLDKEHQGLSNEALHSVRALRAFDWSPIIEQSAARDFLAETIATFDGDELGCYKQARMCSF